MSNDIRNPDPNFTPPLAQAVPLGIQHVLAMFVSNFTPALIIAGVAGVSGGDKVYLIQMAMIFSGIATLFQTVGVGPVGARLPIMQGTSFAFVPVMIPVAKAAGMGAIFGAAIIASVVHFFLGAFIGKLRRFLPPLVTGVIILSIGLALLPVAIKYSAGGVWLMNNKPELFGGAGHWGLALLVVVVTVGVKFFCRGFTAAAAALIGLIVGYIAAVLFGKVNFDGIGDASWFAAPSVLKFGFDINTAAIVGMVAMVFVSAVETVGDVSTVAKSGAGREATDKEIAGATYADGIGSFVAALFGGLPNTSFSQNVGLVALTGVMSRHVVTIGAIFLIFAGFIPKLGAVIAAMPQAVLGGGVIVMFGMVVSAGLNMLSDVKMTRRNMVILALSLAFGLGLQQVPEAVAHANDTVKLLLTTGLLPSAALAIVLNMALPEEV